MSSKVFLARRAAGAYGQDFLFGDVMRSIGLTEIRHDPGSGYPLAELKRAALVVTHNPEDTSDSAAVSALPRAVRLVAHLHLQWDYLNEALRATLRRTIVRADVVVVPAEFMRRTICSLFPSVDCRLIRYGFNTNRYFPATADERSAFLQRAFLGGATNVIHVGRFENAKGLQVLKEITPRLPSDVCLWFQYLANADSKPIRRYQYLADQLHYANQMSTHCIPDENPLSDRPVRYADHLISVSLMEVSPMVILEALLCGLPIIATRSTPFIEELTGLGFGPHVLRVVELSPAITNRGAREHLHLTNGEVQTVAEAVLDVLARIANTSDALRHQIAGLARAVGFTRCRMQQECTELYDELTPSEV